MHKGTILSIDDDENIQTVLGQYLEEDGYKFITAHDSKSALEKLSFMTFDAVLLDLMLPDCSGLTLIPQIRTQSNAVIIVVSGKSETTEKVVCLEMGADDYMTKPFEMREVSARLTANMRRATDCHEDGKSPANQDDDRDSIAFKNGWVLDRGQYQLFDAEKKSIDFTTGEFKLFEALVLAANRAVSREHLFDLTRSGQFDVYDRAIDIQVARIRKKIGDASKAPGTIKTVRGVGYMFTAGA